MESTLQFCHSMRESADIIQGMCLCKNTGNVITHDNNALRLWSIKKQVKSIRLPYKKESLKFFGMTPLDKLNSLLVFYTVRKKSEMKGGLVHLVSNNLIPLQEVDLSYHSIEKFSVSPSQTEMLFLDYKNNGIVVHVQINESNLSNSEKEVAELSSSIIMESSKKKQRENVYNPKKKKIAYIELHETQTINFPVKGIKDILLHGDNKIVAVSDFSIFLYDRKTIFHTTEEIKKSIMSSENESIDDSIKSMKYVAFSCKKCYRIQSTSKNKEVTVLNHAGSNKIVIGFSDGSIQLVKLELLTNDTGKVTQMDEILLICEWTAHPMNFRMACKTATIAALLDETDSKQEAQKPSGKEFYNSVLAISRCRWPIVSGEKGYALELMTVGRDRRVCHWAIRKKSGQEANPESYDNTQAIDGRILSRDELHIETNLSIDDGIAQNEDSKGFDLQSLADDDSSVLSVGFHDEILVVNPSFLRYEVDLLGEYEYPLEPTNKVVGDRTKQAPQCLLSMELSIVNFPVLKRVVGTFGGMLIMLDVLQPRRYLGLSGEKARIVLDSSEDGSEESLYAQASEGGKMMKKEDFNTANPNTIIIASSLGPEISKISKLSQGKSRDNSYVENTIFVLKKFSVDVISVESGKILQDMSSFNIKESMILQDIWQGTLPKKLTESSHSHKAYSSLFVREHVAAHECFELEGSPTHLHWCNLTRLLIVGFSSGGLGILRMSGKIQSLTDHSPFTYLRTNTVHSGDISLIITFKHVMVNKGVKKDIIAALIGDSTGLLSIWQLYPERDSKGSPVLSRTPSSHPGKIIFGHSCVLRDTELSSDRMIVTGCSRGVIKAWQLSSTGALKLVAYFKSANTAKLNTLSVLPIRDFVKYTEDNDDDSNGDDSVIAKKSRAPVDDSSNISDPESPSKGKFYYDLYCVCGFSDGIAESWIMSTNNEVSSTTPAAVYQENTCPILSLSRIPRDDEAFSHRSNLHESIFLRFSNQEKVICGYADGTVVIMGINRKGLLRRISYFNIPGRVNNILINYNQRTTGYIDYDDNSTIQTQSRIDLSIPLECVLINDLAAVEVLANAAGVIPKKWTNPCERVLPYLLLENIREIEERSGVSLVDDRYYRDSMSPVSNPMSGFEYHAVVKSIRDSIQSSTASRDDNSENDVSELKLDSHSLLSGGTALSRKNSDEKRKELIGNMEAKQRLINTELFFAKKDRKLINLFILSDPRSDGTITPEATAHIVLQWINSDLLQKENILELLYLLEIKVTDRLKFIEVAKIAAVVASALTNQASESGMSKSTRVGKSYNTMKAFTIKVTYDSMGEKRIEKIPLRKDTQEGIFNGYSEAIQKIWKEQPCKVLTRSELATTVVIPSKPRLKIVPKAIQNLLQNKFVLPDQWSTKSPHYFDPLRTIRIVRTLLDTRSNKQYELYQGVHGVIKNSSDCVPLEEILVDYFVVNYGDHAMNIANHKVAYFLEACLQYEEYPVINIMNRLIGLKSQNTIPPAAIWLVVETRSLLLSRGLVLQGVLIQPALGADSSGFNNITKDGNAVSTRYNLISRADATSAVDEMLRMRGKFGPTVYLHAMNSIEKIKTEYESIRDLNSTNLRREVNDTQRNPTRSLNTGEELIDFESFLELLLAEYLHFEKEIQMAKNKVFGENQSDIVINAISRDISSNTRNMSPLVYDDQTISYGPFHDYNMDVIEKFLYKCVSLDGVRKGELSQAVFQKLTRTILCANFTGKDRELDELVYQFMQVCLRLFRKDRPDDGISYIDFVATLLAWEEQCLGNIQAHTQHLLDILPSIQRTLERDQAVALLAYLGTMQNLPSLDPIWTMHASILVSNGAPLSISQEGNWNPNCTAPSDEPGLLHIQKQPIYGLSKAQSAVDFKAHKDINNLAALEESRPRILITDRPINTIHGEPIKPPAAGFEPCPIRVVTMDSVAKTIKSAYMEIEKTEIDFKLSRSSYSRSLLDLDENDQKATGIGYIDNQEMRILVESKPVEHFGAGEDSAYSELDRTRSSVHSANIRFPFVQAGTPEEGVRSKSAPTGKNVVSASPTRTPEAARERIRQLLKSPTSNDHFSGILDADDVNGDDSMSLLSDMKALTASEVQNYHDFSTLNFDSSMNIQLNELLTQEEVDRRRQNMLTREEELNYLFQLEKEEFARRRAAKVEEDAKLRKELGQKEKKSMVFLRKSMDERDERRAKGKEHAAAGLLAEEQERRAKEAEIARILEQNKEKSRRLLEEKEARKRREEEQFREIKESEDMLKEERQTKDYYQKLNAMSSAEREAVEKAEAEAVARRMADLAASRAKIPSTPGDRDEEEIEEHDEYEEDEDEVAEEVEEEEEAYVSEDEEKSAVSDAKPYVPPSNEALSAAEKKMKYFMDRMSVCNMRNKGHPRNREGIFFMPQTFAEDIFYDPFQSHYYPGNLLVPLEEMEELIVQGGSSRYVVNDLPKSSNIPTVRGQDINSDESVEIAYRRSIGRGPIRIHLRKVTDLSYGYTEQNYVEAKTEPEVYYDIQQDIDEMAPEEKDPFTDITQSVKDHKSKLEAQRMAELYQTSLDDIASYDYIRIFRQFQKDWYKFFKQERDSQIKYDSDDEDFLYEPDALIASNTGSGLEHSVVGGNSSVTSTGLEIPQSLLDVVDENTVKITPLPFGKVLKKQIIKRKVYQYYQIELLDQSSILTIELNCLKGTADMYVSHEKLPSIIKYEYHVSCNKENDKIGRLTFAPKCSGTFLVAIYSANTGAKYNLWAYGSTDLPEDIPQLLGVTKIINKFNNLLQSNEKQLGIHFPRLEKEATMKSEQQIQHKKEVRDTIRSVIMEMKKIEEEFGTQNLETILHSGEDDEEVLDRENVESFVVKVGRFAMRKERELKEKMKVTQNIDIKTIYDIDDPNYHEDLFSRPKLPNRRAELSLVDKLDDQNESSTIIEPMTNKKSDSFVADGIYMDDTVKPSLLDRNNKSYHNVTAFFSNALGVQSDESHYPNKGLKLPAINSKSYNSSSYDNQNNDSIPNKQSTENASNLRSKTLFVSKSQTEMELDRKTTKSVPKVSKLKRNDVLLKKIPSTISYKLTK